LVHQKLVGYNSKKSNFEKTKQEKSSDKSEKIDRFTIFYSNFKEN
jgi:hypothetical protein